MKSLKRRLRRSAQSGKSWREYLENILIAVLLALIVRTFIITGYKVPTGSMAPTLWPGDFIFSYRLPYGVKIPLTKVKLAKNLPERGDVVVFSYPEQPRVSHVKRVIALPGDRVQIIDGKLNLNGQLFEYQTVDVTAIQNLPNSSYLELVEEKSNLEFGRPRKVIFQKDEKPSNYGPIIVPPNEVFLLGDNRDSSDDSRYWGTVPMERIEGRVVFIWLSLNWQKRVWDNRLPSIRWERTFTDLD